MTPEQRARQEIDRLLTAAGWHVCGVSDANIHAARGVAIREFALDGGHGYADYLLYVDGKAAGVIEAKKAGVPLIGVEHQSGRYVQGLPAALPAWRRPLPFAYESTGIETRFTSGLDPEPRSRPVFAFHQPGTLADWLGGLPPHGRVPVTGGVHDAPPTDTFRRRLRTMPELITEWGDQKLWPAQIQAIRNLEKSLAADKPRALIQMATGSGKTFTAISAIYRLIKFAGARRVLFLVDRGNLGRQAKKEFDQYVSPVNNYKFGEEYIVQHLASNQLDRTARVCISTIQRMYSMLKGRDLPEDEEERSTAGVEVLFREVEPIDYNPAFPIETFDIIVTDEAHRSIYNLWRQVLEYFDAYLIGLTATPKVLDKPTRAPRDWQLDDDFQYAPEELDRSVQTPDQIGTIAPTLRDTVRDLLRTRQLAIEQSTVVLRALARLGDSSGELADALISEGAAAVGCARTVTFDSPFLSPTLIESTAMTDTLQDLARQLDQFAEARDWQQFHSPKNLASALIVEAGELLEHFQWMTDEQSRDLPPGKRDAVAAEAADVLLYLIQLASALGIDPVAAAQGKLKLNEIKYPVDRARGSSKKYDEL